MKIIWANDSECNFRIEDGKGILSANDAGLISLAAQISALCTNASGSNIHYDENNGFQKGTDELIIEKIGENKL